MSSLAKGAARFVPSASDPALEREPDLSIAQILEEGKAFELGTLMLPQPACQRTLRGWAACQLAGSVHHGAWLAVLQR